VLRIDICHLVQFGRTAAVLVLVIAKCSLPRQPEKENREG